MQKGADIHAQDHRRWTPLFHASAGGVLEVCKLLVQMGAATSSYDITGGLRPIDLASRYEQEDVVAFFCQHARCLRKSSATTTT